MGISTERFAACDECGQAIDVERDEYVDAGVYGAAFHSFCWDKIGGPRVARILYLDEISVRRAGERVRRAMEQLR